MKIALMHNINRHNGPEEMEYDLPETIDALTQALSSQHEVLPIECHPHVAEWVKELVRFAPDLIFSVAEGVSSAAREAFYPALYEQLGIPYIGNDPTTMLITHNKLLTKRIVEAVGIKTPRCVAISSDEDLERLESHLQYPLIVKPNSEGSSLGIDNDSVVYSFDRLILRVHYIWERFNNIALAEEYIARGMDISMTYVEGLGKSGIFGPVVYDYPDGDIFDGQLKGRSYPTSILTFPETMKEEQTVDVVESMRRAIKALDVRGYARADFRLDPQGSCFFLEMNGQAEIKPSRSDFMAPVFKAGYTFDETILHLVEYAASHPRRRPSMAGLYERELVLGQGSPL